MHACPYVFFLQNDARLTTLCQGSKLFSGHLQEIQRRNHAHFLRWMDSWDGKVKPLPQHSQMSDFGLWEYSCCRTCLKLVLSNAQCAQRNIWPLLCFILKCSIRSCFLLYSAEHLRHGKADFVSWMTACLCNAKQCWKTFPQLEHLRSFFFVYNLVLLASCFADKHWCTKRCSAGKHTMLSVTMILHQPSWLERLTACHTCVPFLETFLELWLYFIHLHNSASCQPHTPLLASENFARIWNRARSVFACSSFENFVRLHCAARSLFWNCSWKNSARLYSTLRNVPVKWYMKPTNTFEFLTWNTQRHRHICILVVRENNTEVFTKLQHLNQIGIIIRHIISVNCFTPAALEQRFAEVWHRNLFTCIWQLTNNTNFNFLFSHLLHEHIAARRDRSQVNGNVLFTFHGTPLSISKPNADVSVGKPCTAMQE